MLNEERTTNLSAHHRVDRVVGRTAELMREHNTDEVAAHWRHPVGRDPEVHQLHYSLSLAFRLRAVHHAGQLLHRRAQGPLAEDGAGGRTRCSREDGAPGGPWSRTEPYHTRTRCPRWLALNQRPSARSNVQGIARAALKSAGTGCWTRPGSGRQNCTCRTSLQPPGRDRSHDHHHAPAGTWSARTRGSARKDSWLPTEADKTHVRR